MTDTPLDMRGFDPQEAAIAWHLAMPSMSEAHWHAFTAWLEADPVHAAAYDAVAQADHVLGQVPRQPKIISIPQRSLGSHRQRWIGGALAASVAVLLVVGVQLQNWQPGAPQGGNHMILTPAGTVRTLALGSGSSVTLNGGTRLAFDPASPRAVRLEKGEALFSVRHDAAHPFTVDMGRFRVVDVGTVFNISRDGGIVSVAVSEGRVLFDPEGVRLALGAGDAVRVDEGQGTVTRVAATGVGGWRDGEMQFNAVPLKDVVAAIHRRTGADIRLSDPLSNLPFTGNIKLSGQTSGDVRHLADLVGADVRREGETWLLSPAGSTR